jgi:hypothetical protein
MPVLRAIPARAEIHASAISDGDGCAAAFAGVARQSSTVIAGAYA